ncbi:hypothetical protein CYMTET_49971 [Cymbomonas tetramitiformis]|uniref:Uncharacterized protein n=1 Tax=Cymbomonas tetramitiformis TaxID=36881 RepID=A0AAE0EU67_9CHLO|nr:hypothetical protein CYMTET_49971 [Cymbomonas tetramitiformis]
METKVDAGTTQRVQSQLLVAVQQLSPQMSSPTVRVKEMETRRMRKLAYSLVSMALLEFIEDKIHDTEANMVRSAVLDRWFREFEDLKTEQNLKHAANKSSRGYSAEDALNRKGMDRDAPPGEKTTSLADKPAVRWAGEVGSSHAVLPYMDDFLSPPVARHRVGMQLEVFWKDDDVWYPCTITSVSGNISHVVYADGDKEELDLRALAKSTHGNYWPKALAFTYFCVGAGSELVLLYMGLLMRWGTVPVESMQPYLSVINKNFEHLKFDGQKKEYLSCLGT